MGKNELMSVSPINRGGHRWAAAPCCFFILLLAGCSSDVEPASQEVGEPGSQEVGESASQIGEPVVICIRDNKDLEFNSKVFEDLRTFAETVADACSKALKAEETEPAKDRTHRVKRIVNIRHLEPEIQVAGSTTVGLLTKVVDELRLAGFDKFVLLAGESHISVSSFKFHLNGPDLDRIVLEMMVAQDGSLFSGLIMRPQTGEVLADLRDTSQIDVIVESVEKQIKKLEPPGKSRRELDIELKPGAPMSAVYYFKLCAALQALIDKRAPTSKLDINLYPIGYPSESKVDLLKIDIDGGLSSPETRR